MLPAFCKTFSNTPVFSHRTPRHRRGCILLLWRSTERQGPGPRIGRRRTLWADMELKERPGCPLGIVEKRSKRKQRNKEPRVADAFGRGRKLKRGEKESADGRWTSYQYGQEVSFFVQSVCLFTAARFSGVGWDNVL